MKKKANAGFTLMEMLVTLVVMVLLTVGIGVGMNSATQAYRSAIFDSDSAMLANTVNTSLGDMLRYSKNVRSDTDHGFLFTNLEYGVQDGYFYGTSADGVLQLYDSQSSKAVELVNSGAYPDLKIENLSVEYVSEGDSGGRKGYFNVSYDIVSATNSSLTREVTTVIRLL